MNETYIDMATLNYSKMSMLIECIKAGSYPVIRWVDPTIEEYESYDVGMLCRAIGIIEKDSCIPGIILYGILTDFSEFEEYNKSIATNSWIPSSANSDKDWVKWHESEFYPETKKANVYMQLAEESSGEKSSGDMFEFLDAEAIVLFNEYASEKTTLPYVAWLEDKVTYLSSIT
jgi:hypothetical protein